MLESPKNFSVLIEKLNEQSQCMDKNFAAVMRSISTAGNIGRRVLETSFTGISYATWRNYMRDDYTVPTPVAALAAFSWLSGISMKCFFWGLNFQDVLGLSNNALKILAKLSQLNADQFDLAAHIAFTLLPKEVQKEVSENYLKFRLVHRSLKNIDFVRPLNYSDFSADYRQSCATAVAALQRQLKLADSVMSSVIGVTVDDYYKIIDINGDLQISAVMGARLKIGLNLDDTSFLLDHMKTYPQFKELRHAQEVRDILIRPLLAKMTCMQLSKLGKSIGILF